MPDDIHELLARLGQAVRRHYHRTVTWVHLELAEDTTHTITLPCPTPDEPTAEDDAAKRSASRDGETRPAR